MHVITKGRTMRFNPDDFFTTTTVKDIAPAFPHLEALDFSTCSLNDETMRNLAGFQPRTIISGSNAL